MPRRVSSLDPHSGQLWNKKVTSRSQKLVICTRRQQHAALPTMLFSMTQPMTPIPRRRGTITKEAIELLTPFGSHCAKIPTETRKKLRVPRPIDFTLVSPMNRHARTKTFYWRTGMFERVVAQLRPTSLYRGHEGNTVHAQSKSLIELRRSRFHFRLSAHILAHRMSWPGHLPKSITFSTRSKLATRNKLVASMITLVAYSRTILNTYCDAHVNNPPFTLRDGNYSDILALKSTRTAP